jgi:hypothetical protein
LAHELAHADRGAHGAVDQTPRTDNFQDNEEHNAVQEENKYRKERGPWPGMPEDNLRHDYTYNGL